MPSINVLRFVSQIVSGTGKASLSRALHSKRWFGGSCKLSVSGEKAACKYVFFICVLEATIRALAKRS